MFPLESGSNSAPRACSADPSCSYSRKPAAPTPPCRPAAPRNLQRARDWVAPCLSGRNGGKGHCAGRKMMSASRLAGRALQREAPPPQRRAQVQVQVQMHPLACRIPPTPFSLPAILIELMSPIICHRDFRILGFLSAGTVSVPWCIGGAAGIPPRGRQSTPPSGVAAWAAAETERILGTLPLPPAESAEQAAKALARMRQPLLTHLSRSCRGLPPDGHLHWAAEVEQLLHTLLGIGWSPSTLASFVAKGPNALTQTAAGVQQGLNYLQQEGGLTAEEAARAFGLSFGYMLGYNKISTLQQGLEQLRAAGLSAGRVRQVLRHECRILTTTPLIFKKKLDCLQGAKTCSAWQIVCCISLCLLPRLGQYPLQLLAYIADKAHHAKETHLSGVGLGYSRGEIHDVIVGCPSIIGYSTDTIEEKHAAWGRQLGVTAAQVRGMAVKHPTALCLDPEGDLMRLKIRFHNEVLCRVNVQPPAV